MSLKKIKAFLGMDRTYKTRPPGLHWRSHTLFITSTIAIGLFTDLFLYNVVVPVLPYLLQERIGVPPEDVQPYVSRLLAADAGASVLFSPVAGYIADKTSSRQIPFLSGLAALLFATILLYVGQNEPVLLIARVLQGISGAIVWTIGLALCLDTVGPKNLGKTIGSIFSFIGFGSLIAPVIGGVVYEKAGFTGVFGVGIGILALDFIMRILVIEKKIAHRYDSSIEDPFLSSDVSRPSDSDSEDSSEDEEQPLLNDTNSATAESKYTIPSNQPSLIRKVPLLYCLRDPRLLSSLLVALIQASLIGSFDATVTTEAQSLFNFTSLEAGLLFIPLGICDLFVGPLAGWAVDKYGVKPVAVLSYGFLTPVLISLRSVHAGGKDQIILYCVILGLCGVGLAAIGAPSIVEAGDVMNKYHRANPEFFGDNGPYAQLYGLNSMVFSAGLALGPALSGTLRDAIGYGDMNAVLGVITAVTSLVCYVFLGGRPRCLRGRRGRKEVE